MSDPQTTRRELTRALEALNRRDREERFLLSSYRVRDVVYIALLLFALFAGSYALHASQGSVDRTLGAATVDTPSLRCWQKSDTLVVCDNGSHFRVQ